MNIFEEEYPKEVPTFDFNIGKRFINDVNTSRDNVKGSHTMTTNIADRTVGTNAFEASKSDTSNLQLFMQKNNNMRSSSNDRLKNSFQREWENSNGFDK